MECSSNQNMSVAVNSKEVNSSGEWKTCINSFPYEKGGSLDVGSVELIEQQEHYEYQDEDENENRDVNHDEDQDERGTNEIITPLILFKISSSLVLVDIFLIVRFILFSSIMINILGGPMLVTVFPICIWYTYNICTHTIIHAYTCTYTNTYTCTHTHTQTQILI